MVESEIPQSYWLVNVVQKSIEHAVQNHVLKTVDNDLNRGLLSFRYLEIL